MPKGCPRDGNTGYWFQKGMTPWNKGVSRTEEERENISSALKGRASNKGSFVKGQVAWNKGQQVPKESVDKMRLALEEGYASGRIKVWNKGKPHSEETCKKISRILTGRSNPRKGIPSGVPSYWKGKHLRPEMIEKLKNAVGRDAWNVGLTKEDHPSLMHASLCLKGVPMSRDHVERMAHAKLRGHHRFEDGVFMSKSELEVAKLLREHDVCDYFETGKNCQVSLGRCLVDFRLKDGSFLEYHPNLDWKRGYVGGAQYITQRLLLLIKHGFRDALYVYESIPDLRQDLIASRLSC